MQLSRLQRVVIDALEDIKGQDIRVYNTTRLSDLFDRVVLVTATSNRQTRALASNVAEKAKQAGATVLSVEGEEAGEWVLVDLGDVVVHIMQPAIRAYYALEEIWGDEAVRVRLAPESRSGHRAAGGR
jgi:ribosome-associated protein